MDQADGIIESAGLASFAATELGDRGKLLILDQKSFAAPRSFWAGSSQDAIGV